MVLAHLVQDRPLGARGDDRVGDALDPDARPAAAAAVGGVDRLERVDLVGARVLAEAEEDHPGRAVRHLVIMHPSVGSRAMPRIYLSPPHLTGRELELREGRDRLELGRAARAARRRVRAGARRAGRRPSTRSRSRQRHRRAAPRAGRARHRAGRRGRLLVADVLREREPDPSTSARRRCSSTPTPPTWTLDPALLERALAERPRSRRSSRSTSTASAATTTRSGSSATRTACRSSRTRPSRSARPTATRRPAARATSPRSPSTATR